nr:neuroblast differentiation-associated protein AHNAK isoform X31 [Syngnathus scovelli]
MDPETFDEQTDQTPAKAAEPPVEIMVETEAEAGASGYSVTGGGERGIFIKDVLKDSPAAKHLSLQQGDQLLSAKVYFDNVRYEDALKILQCAEPYKVSFLVKRTIQGEDVYLRPRLPSVDIKGPKTKVAKMSVKAIKPFKAKKKRGGRFGLRRLKEKRREELVIEGTPPRLDISDVDVEFCLPKFKHRQSGHLEADGGSAAKEKRKIRFPGMKIKGQSGGKEDSGRMEAKVKVSPAEIPAAKVKAKGKAPMFGINFPKSKDAKSGTVELKKPGVNIASPSLEFSLPAGKGVEVEMGGASLNSPDVEFALPSIQAGASLPAEKGKVEIKGPKVEVRGADAKVSMGKVDVETGKGDGKLQMPKLKLPKMRLSRHLDEKDDKMKVKAEGEISVPTVEIKGGSGIVVPEVNVTKGNVPSLPSVDISLPKVKGTSDMDVKTSIKTPGMDFSVPDVDLHVGRIPDEVEGTFKGPEISMPTLDISLPKMGSSDLDVGESRGKFSLPSAEIGVDMSHYIGGDGTFSLPSFDVSQSQKAHLKGPDVKGEFKMPSVDLTLPKGKDVDLNVPSISLPEGNVKLKGPEFKAGRMEMPDIDVSLPKGKLEGGVELQGPDIQGGKFKMPSLDVSLPKVNLPEGGVKLKGPELKGGKMDMPDIDVSLPKVEGDLDIEGPDVKGGKFKLPTFDVSLPKVNLPEGGVKLKGPQFKGKMDMPDVDVSLPKGQLEGGVELQGPDVKGAKFKMPSLDVSLPKVNLPEGGVKIKGQDLDRRKIEMPDFDIEGPDIKGGQIKMPKLDVSLPKISLPEGGVKMKGPDLGEVSLKGKTEGEMGIEGHLGKGGKFHMPSVDFSLPKMKTKGPEINIEGLDGKGGKVTMPTMDVSLPKVQGELDLQGPDIRGGKFKKPTVDVSLPKVSLPESGLKLQGPEFRGKMEAPDVDISIPKIEGDIEGPHVKGGKFKMPTIDVSLPKVNLPEGGVKLKGPEFKGAKMDMPDIDVSLPKGKLEGGVQLQGPDVKGGKFRMPSLDVSLPKVNLPEGGVKLKGPEISGGKTGMADLDVSFPKGKVEGEIGFEGHVGKKGKFHMPTVDISLPKVKTKAPEINIEGPDVKGAKVTMPTVDVSLPKVEGDLDLEGPDVKGGKFKIPTWDISLPKANLPEGGLRMKGPELKGGKMEIPDMDVSLPKGKIEDDVDFEGPDVKGGKLKMPKIDVSLPKVNLPEGNVKLKGPEFKGAKMDMPDIDVSLPKGKAEGEMRIEGHVDKGKFHMPSVDISLPKMKAKGPHINIEEHEIKGGKVAMPTVDVSLPTIKSPEVDFSLEGPDVKGGKRGAVKLPTVDISAPKVDLDFGLTKPKGDDVEVALLKAEGSRPSSGGSFDLPNVSLKAPSFTLPRFGGKSKSGRLEVSGQSSEGDISLKAPSVELGLDSTVKGKKGKLKMPSFGISPADADVSASCPEFDVNTKKGDIAIPKPDVDVKGKGHFHAPDVTIKLPKFSMPGKPSGDLEAKAKAKMPSVELSLPATKSPEMEVLLPKAEVDVSQCDIQTYEGDLKIPKKPGIDVTVPKVDLDVPLPKIKLESSSERGAKFKMPDVDLSLPKGKIGSLPKSKSLKMEAPEVELKMQSIDVSLPKPPDADVHGDGQGTFKTPRADIDLPETTMPKTDISMKMPRLDITGPKGDLELDLRLRKGDTKVDVSDVETNSKVKGPKVKGTKFNIGMPKKKNGGGVKVEVSGLASTNHNGHKEGNVNVQMPGVALPSAGVKIQEGSAERGLPSSSSAVPRIPDIDFDIGTAQDEDEDKLGKRIKIPKFGVPLPSLSSPEGRLELCGSESKQEGPKIKKAVFVLVNPPQTDNVTLNTGDVKVKTSKFQTKTMETSVSTTVTSVCASPVKTEDPMSGFHFEKDSKPHKGFKSEDVAASGKVKLPKVEFTSPYGKKAAGDANFEMATRLGKPSLSGEASKGLQIKPGKVSFEGFAEESSGEVVSHHSRTERLDQDTLGSPAAFTMGFSSTKFQTWSEGDTIEDPQGTEAPSWFKVPKVTLKPHSTGFLQITPEGSPQAQRRGELGGEANLSGSFCQQSSDITTREVSSARGGGSVTVVTKTTRTKQHSTPAGTSAGHWLGTTHPPSDL